MRDITETAAAEGVRTFTAGYSVQRRPIVAWEIEGSSAPAGRLLLLGRVHGDEPQGQWLLERLIRQWTRRHPAPSFSITAVPCVNPDGALLSQRVNARGVDLNRNMPTADWSVDAPRLGNHPGAEPGSEPETRAILDLLERGPVTAIVSIHSMKRYQINCNGPALEWGRHLESICHYPVTEDIGYPCPGSLGTYAGAERQIPTITLETDSQAPMEETLRVHLPVVQEAVGWWEARAGQ